MRSDACFVALGLALATAAPACIIHGDGFDDEMPHQVGGGGSVATGGGDIRFTVFLDGRTCDEVPEVATLHVVIDGANAILDELQLCPPAGMELVGQDFPAGTYAWALAALDSRGVPLYRATGVVTVSGGDVSVVANLAPVASTAGGTVTFLWTFDGAACAQAKVLDVRVEIGGLDETVACSAAGTEGVSIDGLPEGPAAYRLTGLDADGLELFAATGEVAVPASGETQETVDLVAAGNSLELVWTFAGQGSCPIAGVSEVAVVLRAGDVRVHDETYDCGAGLSRIPGLALGTYEADLTGLDAAGQVVYEATAVPVVVGSGTTTQVVDLTAP